MKNAAFFLVLLAFASGCSHTPPARPTDPSKQMAFDLVNPGGPVYEPREFIASEPPPVDPPFGKYFVNDQPDTPPSMRDPYWITGYWAWRNNLWDWVEGRWVERPKSGMLWINARYVGGSRQIWQTGYWQ